MALTNEQLSRLSELLDTSLSMPPMQRGAWLDSLPEKDRPLVQALRESFANQLAAIPELRVTGRTSSFSFKGKNEDLRVIAKKLDVANLLEGSLRGDGQKLRVTVQLIDGRDGTRRLGDRDLALTALRQHVTRIRGRASTWWQPWLLVHSGARADPRFNELVREAGLPEFWRQRQVARFLRSRGGR